MSKLLYFDFLIAALAKHFAKFMRQDHEIKHIRDHSKVILEIDILVLSVFYLMFSLKPHHPRTEVLLYSENLVYYLIIDHNNSNFSFIIFVTL